MRAKLISAAAVLSLVMTGCTWVPLTEEGEKARLLVVEEVASCKQVGTIEVSVKARVAGINRGAEKVEEELSNLARNGAEGLGGDTVVAISEVEDGVQNYAVYDCVQ